MKIMKLNTVFALLHKHKYIYRKPELMQSTKNVKK